VPPFGSQSVIHSYIADTAMGVRGPSPHRKMRSYVLIKRPSQILIAKLIPDYASVTVAPNRRA